MVRSKFMEVKIVKDGGLQLKRAGKYKDQYCPYCEDYRCSDMCALFGEPAEGEEGKTLLSLCRKVIIGEIIDERKFGGDQE